MATSNKLLLGLLITILLFITVMLSIGKYQGFGSHVKIEFGNESEVPATPVPPAPPAPPAPPEAPAAPVPAE